MQYGDLQCFENYSSEIAGSFRFLIRIGYRNQCAGGVTVRRTDRQADKHRIKIIAFVILPLVYIVCTMQKWLDIDFLFYLSQNRKCLQLRFIIANMLMSKVIKLHHTKRFDFSLPIMTNGKCSWICTLYFCVHIL